MTPVERTTEARIQDVRRVLDAARVVHAMRAHLAEEIARATGLSPQGVELGFESLERDASDDELHALVARAGDTPRVHVILSANVFVAPVRAIAVARAAAPRVAVRPSSRDPTLARALVDALAAAGDDTVALESDRDVVSIAVGEIHVYGRGETVSAVRARARVPVRAHGPGMGIAAVSSEAGLDEAADGLAADVVAFDQRGCLSPRVALVEGDPARVASFAALLHERLRDWGNRVPRGSLSPEERADAARWLDAATFTGECRTGVGHAVALAPPVAPLAIPPPGRHVLIAGAPTLADAFGRIAPFARFVVAVGSDDPSRVAALAPSRARGLRLGGMQRPPLDGPVDLR
jgi:hypothetical protein